jgi:UDP-N-acetylglucosamine diphosphorylase / glucose-1-phosphate thymidylyltransferase / UDP-N-acetylgalactosamine diphosphorylase / glucosamine-1-phosphate N-acetyltransferase / galactosamine-1-phosphate N-acetyltransferase
MKLKRPVRAAFRADDPPFVSMPCRFPSSLHPGGSLYLADLWYYPNGPVAGAEPLVIDMQAREIGYYHVPTYMGRPKRRPCFQVPLRSMMAIDSWVHVFIADMVFSQFARGARFEKRLNEDLGFKIKISAKPFTKDARFWNLPNW